MVPAKCAGHTRQTLPRFLQSLEELKSSNRVLCRSNKLGAESFPHTSVLRRWEPEGFGMPQRMAGAKTVFPDNLLPESSGATEAPEGGSMLNQEMKLVGEWCIAASEIGVLQVILLLASIAFWVYGTRDPLSRRFMREVRHSIRITAHRCVHEAAHITYNVRRLVDAAEWRMADAIVGAWLAIDGVVTSIGLNLLAHETYNNARKRQLRRLRKARMERKCQRKIAREKACAEQLAEIIRQAESL